MPTAEKEFVLKHVFKNVSEMKEEDKHFSNIEQHFGVPWKMSVHRKADHLAFYIYCEQKQLGKWSIETWRDARILAVTGKSCSKTSDREFGDVNGITDNWGWKQFVTWDEMMKDYVIDDSIVVETHVKIQKMTGIEKKNLRNFDNSMQQFSDVVLVIGDQKFHVLKLYLASQSTYFEALFLRNFEESKKFEITLTGIDPKDFQNFLELLYGESPIEESTIEGILHLADMYDAKIAIRKCEQFLIEISEKSLKKKLELAHRYRLEILKDYCLSKITSVADICSVVTNDLSEMDPSVVRALLQKSLSLHATN